MAGYIGKSQGVTQVDGYTTSEADSEFVNDPNAALNISSSASADSATIDASGNLLVGTTDYIPSSNNDSGGVSLRGTGQLNASRDGAAAIDLNRKTSDGDIAVFRKDGSTVGRIGTTSGAMHFVNANCGIRVASTPSRIVPANGSGSNLDNSVDLGYSSVRWKNLYLSGGVYLGGTGSANYLDDYEVGSWQPTIGSTTGTATTTSQTYLHYVKVGDLVHVNGQLDISGSSTSGASITVSVPFASAGVSGDGRATFPILVDSTLSVSPNGFAGQIQEGTAYFSLNVSNSGNLSSNSVGDQINSRTTYWKFSFTYRAA